MPSDKECRAVIVPIADLGGISHFFSLKQRLILHMYASFMHLYCINVKTQPENAIGNEILFISKKFCFF